MRLKVLIAGCLALIGTTVYADWSVAPTTPTTKRIVIVMDVSGSMNDDSKFEKAFGCLLPYLTQGNDGYQVALIAFDGSTYRWEGVREQHCPVCTEEARGCDWSANCKHGPCTFKKERCVPEDWSALPQDLAGQASKLLNSLLTQGVTRVTPALTQALKEPRKELTVVLISDGIFNMTSGTKLLAAVDKLQKWRLTEHDRFCRLKTSAVNPCKGCLGMAVITTYSVANFESTVMTKLGTKYGGGVFRHGYVAPVDSTTGPK